jgi:hypothetical protein
LTTDGLDARLSDEAVALLWKSEGWSVEAPGGHVGVVEDAVRIPGLKVPATIAVCLDEGGTRGTRVALVPITEILAVDAEARTITLRERP